MSVLGSEYEDRVEHWLRTLTDDLYEPIGDISWEMFTTMEQIPFEEACASERYVPVSTGYKWGHEWEYAWMRTVITIPESAKGRKIALKLEPGGEAAVFVNGKCFGTRRADWVDVEHHYIVDNVLCDSAVPGTKYEIYLEAYAGQYFPEHDGCATGPILPGAYMDPAIEGERATVGQSTFGIWNDDAHQLYLDAFVLYRLLGELDQTSLRASRIADALEKFTRTVDFEQDREGRSADYRKAREVLKPVLEAHNGPSAPQYYAIGNSHLDLAWLWPIHETYRKTERTFAQQLRLLEKYPDYRYIQSQPASYEMCRKYYPELFERIRESIKAGRWIADGAMWVEPDTNMTSGESLIRQLMHGKRYYKDVLGVNSEVLWLPDTFGYSAALPQILKGCGVKYLVTQKIFWSYNDGERFPYHYFNWEGMDGTKVISFLPTSYTYRPEPKEMTEIWKERSQIRDLDAFLVPYGYGDGGGGPASDHIECVRRMADLEGLPKMKHTSPREFFAEMEERTGGPKNTYRGELYFSAHRGTYTSQAMIKKFNRRNEFMMHDMEVWGAAELLNKISYDYDAADEMWKTILLHQFHDILPGSCIGKVYKQAEVTLSELAKRGEGIIAEGLSSLTAGDVPGAVTVFNSLAFTRRAAVELDEAFAGGARLADGTPVTVNKDGDRLRALVTLPSLGAVTLYPVSGSDGLKKEEGTIAKAVQTEGGFILENSKARAFVTKTGEVTSFILKSSGREFAADTMNRLLMYKDVPRVFDAWDIDSNYRDAEPEGAFDITVGSPVSGIEASVKVTGHIGVSSFTQRIVLAADSTRLEFRTEVDWKELHRLLKVAFPVDVYADEAVNEIQFGYIKRPVHRSRLYDKDRFEVCNHRYTALADYSHGAAVLNDCKYGISVNENVMEPTLLRAPGSPEMRADNRVHEFTYAFTAWDGSFDTSDVVRQGLELNVPVRTAPGSLKDFSLAEVSHDGIILDTVKPAEDRSGDIILRLYESKRAVSSSTVSWHGSDEFEAYLCDMLENRGEALEVKDGTFTLDFKAFEVKTVRIVRK